MAIQRLQFRRGTAAAWTAANPTLASGEPGYEEDTHREKRGTGTLAWNDLPYYGEGGGGSGATGAAFNFKGTVATVGALPTTGNTNNDLRVVTGNSHGYVWNGTAWLDLGVLTVSGGGQATITSYATVSSLPDYPTSFPPAAHSHPATGISDSSDTGRAVVTGTAAQGRSALQVPADTAVVKLTGDQSIAGAKHFTGDVTIDGLVNLQDGSLAISDINDFAGAVAAAANDLQIPRFLTYTGATLPADPGDGWYAAVKTDTATPLPITVNRMIAGGFASGTDASNYTLTLDRAFASGTVGVVFIGDGVVSGGTAPTATSLAGGFPTWTATRVNNTVNGSSSGTLFIGTGTPNTDTALTVVFSGTAGACVARVLEVVNGTVKSTSTMDQSTAATPTATLTGVATANTVIGFCLQQTGTDMGVGTGFTEIGSLVAAPSAPPALSLKTEINATGQNSVGFTGAISAQKLVCAVEIQPK